MCSASLTSPAVYSSLLFITIIVRFRFLGFFLLLLYFFFFFWFSCPQRWGQGTEPAAVWCSAASWGSTTALPELVPDWSPEEQTLPAVSNWWPELMVHPKAQLVSAGYGSGLSQGQEQIAGVENQLSSPCPHRRINLLSCKRLNSCSQVKFKFLIPKENPW